MTAPLRKSISVGDIKDSRFWAELSIGSRFYFGNWFIYFSPTYNGTKYGFMLGFPFGTFIAHIR